MRIGIDLDNTICRTTEEIEKVCDEYSKRNNVSPLEIFNDEKLKYVFFEDCLDKIYNEVEIKRDVCNVIRRLRSKGNEIIIITARSNEFVPSVNNVKEITMNWLNKNKVVVDDIIINAYGEKKGIACKENNIDVMIDDDPFNYKMITSYGIRCLLFDDREKYDLREDYVTSWLGIEREIERINRDQL